ncbi:hypothetical protein Nepgr_032377 [Nepenthes gracilis]|uniref:Uncharacterized protein n=1 Tax=Nepenthes gracilis TaxID=150966 RepID=A0AAD3TJW0_NEPGR|nr:hypothetical protein Nepgr_032377 [Nepenthes gracilis]
MGRGGKESELKAKEIPPEGLMVIGQVNWVEGREEVGEETEEDANGSKTESNTGDKRGSTTRGIAKSDQG